MPGHLTANIRTPFGEITVPLPMRTRPTAKIIDVSSIQNFKITDPAAGEQQGVKGLLVILAVIFEGRSEYSLYGSRVSIALSDDNECVPTIYAGRINFRDKDSDGNEIRKHYDFPAEMNLTENNRIYPGENGIRILPCLIPGKDSSMHRVTMAKLKEVRMVLKDGRTPVAVEWNTEFRRSGFIKKYAVRV